MLLKTNYFHVPWVSCWFLYCGKASTCPKQSMPQEAKFSREDILPNDRVQVHKPWDIVILKQQRINGLDMKHIPQSGKPEQDLEHRQREDLMRPWGFGWLILLYVTLSKRLNCLPDSFLILHSFQPEKGIVAQFSAAPRRTEWSGVPNWNEPAIF